MSDGLSNRDPMDQLYRFARKEHAYRLSSQGKKAKEIGSRLGVCSDRAAQMIKDFDRYVQYSVSNPGRGRLFTVGGYEDGSPLL